MSVTLIIIIITCIVSIPSLQKDDVKEKFLFWPYRINKNNEYYRFVSGALVHADSMHLLFNMVTLYSFGTAIETFLFPIFFQHQSIMLYVLMYVLAIIASCIPDYIKYRNVYSYRALGASGAVSAVIFSAILLEPSMPLRFFFIPIDIPGWLFGFVFLGLSAYLSRRGGDNIGHNAHFWGGVFGLIFTYLASRAFTDVNLIQRFIEQVL
ncbi:MAG TPA: rhomboid family intramembrane serine protease [Chitinophagaceae bacterium]|nr:rhomboid family intramembrane serine protease [Chitinophagaceae bacterium]